jgi:hypothetical protein
MKTRNFLLIALGCGFCGGSACLPQITPTDALCENIEADGPPAVARDMDIQLKVSGGNVGFYLGVRITPGGDVYVRHDDRQAEPTEPARTLSEAESNSLDALLGQWDELPDITEEFVGWDLESHEITYHGRTLSWSDFQPNVPERLSDIEVLIRTIEQSS